MFGWLDRAQPLALTVIRVVLGVVMTAHGYTKVFGGLSKHAAFVHSLGIPGWLGYVSAFAEFGCGILLIIGLVTRFAAFAICIDLLVAIFKVHINHGLTGQGGYEFPLALAAIAFALIFFGGGPISADWLFSTGGRGSRK
jgi:putative oxidoreductase